MSHSLAVSLTIALTIVAVLLAVTVPGRPQRRRLHVLDRSGNAASAEGAGALHDDRSGRRASRAATALVVLGLLVGLGLLFGARGSVFGATGVLIVGTVILLIRRRGKRADALNNRTAVAQACSILAAQVRIGQVPSEALRSAAEDCPVLAPARDTLAIGGDPVGCWRGQSTEPGLAGLADLGRAWQLSISTGAELAAALVQVAEALTSDQALGLVITSEAAAPRATGKIMAVLPVVGIALGYMMGGDPLTFLITSPIGWACFAVGSFCACVGVLWMEKIADRATAEV